MKKILILSFLFVLIFNSCSDDSINLAGTTWTSAKDWYGKLDCLLKKALLI